MTTIRRLWADPRLRRTVYTIAAAVAAYILAIISGAPLPTP